MIDVAKNGHKIYRCPKGERIPGAVLAFLMILFGIALFVDGQPISDPRSYVISAFFVLVGIAFGYLMLGTRLRTTPDYIEYRGFLSKKKIAWGQIESVAINSYGLLVVWHENMPDSENKAADAKRVKKLIPLHLFVKNWWELQAWEQHALGREIKAYAPYVFDQIQNMLHIESDTNTQIPAMPLVTRIKRATMVGVIGSLLLGLVGPWTKSAGIPMFIAFLTGVFVAGFAFQAETLSGRKVRLTSVLIAFGICVITGYLAGFWHLLLCHVLSFARDCNTGNIQATIFVSIFMSNLMVFVEAIPSLFEKRH